MSTLVVDVAAATTRPLATSWWSTSWLSIASVATGAAAGSTPSAVVETSSVAPGATSAFVDAQWLQLWFLFASLVVLGKHMLHLWYCISLFQVGGGRDRDSFEHECRVVGTL
ncbi:BZ3500_MvSof-1268-A1-R1_Chr1-1g01170 [Microbotryum saponariae]|uniref:BZ3500_MvSof-1268-A1-R1_Chr1-1g01170 protein n=1 Tax=Microbotryum saponariae TaxID=289078 RepID=A0A2X0MC84_9BASI|nr:BZ3500_MvSof-1268-A1-R1_Chr1-1g01170 [Microbotryum saponariae]SCZ93565.1 BZ3501_MvSof-1269-A2-R1_Chr1-1g00766 [Microbotryum saponariae]